MAAEREDLAILEAESRRRGTSLAAVLREIVAREADVLRGRHRPRFGVGKSTSSRRDQPRLTSTRPRTTAADGNGARPGHGPILALLDAADPDHDACVAMVDQVVRPRHVEALRLLPDGST